MAEIQNLTNPESWSHCNGKDNPADSATRGKSADDLIQSTLVVWLGFFTVPARSEEPEENCVAEMSVQVTVQYAPCTMYWAKVTQEQSFSKEIHLLKIGPMVDKGSNQGFKSRI